MTRRSDSQRGLTLIELLVALIIVAGLFMLVTPAVQGALGVRVKEEAGRLAGDIAFLYNHAAVTGEYCRITFELPGEEGDGGGYQAECTDRSPRLVPDPDRVRDGRVESGFTDPFADDSNIRDEEQLERTIKQRAQWTQFAGQEMQTRRFGRGVRLAGVWTPRVDDVVTAGPAHLYFFPGGETQRAYLWLQDSSDNFYTLVVQPLTGRVKVHNENLEVPDA